MDVYSMYLCGVVIAVVFVGVASVLIYYASLVENMREYVYTKSEFFVALLPFGILAIRLKNYWRWLGK